MCILYIVILFVFNLNIFCLSVLPNFNRLKILKNCKHSTCSLKTHIFMTKDISSDVYELDIKNVTERYSSILNEDNDLSFYFSEPHDKFIVTPTSITNKVSDEIWNWWQERKLKERNLQNAIASNISNILPYFDEYKPFLASEKADILQANEDFFTALNEGNLDLMKALWQQSDLTLCLSHYAESSAVHGYENIIALWEELMTNKNSATPNNRLYPVNVEMSFQGSLATISCQVVSKSTLNLYGSSGKKSKTSKSKVYSVFNIFEKDVHSDRYRLITHIGTKLFQTDSDSKEALYLQKVYMDPTREKAKPKRNKFGSNILRQLIGERFNGDEGGIGSGKDDDDDDDEEEEEESDEGETRISIYSNSDDDDEDDDDDDEEDDDDSDDSDGDVTINFSNGDGFDTNSLQNKLKQAFSRAILNSEGGNVGKVFVIGKSNLNKNYKSITELLNGIGFKSKTKAGRNDDEDDDENDDAYNDDDEDDDEDEEQDRFNMNDVEERQLAARTITALRYLYNKQRISSHEKKVLISDILSNIGSLNFTQIEMAFSLLICGGRPGFDSLVIPDPYFDLSSLDPEDVNDFEDMCHIVYKTLRSSSLS